MGKIKIILIVISIFVFGSLPVYSSEGLNIPVTDSSDNLLIGFFDLRDRETFVQVTNIDGAESETVHVQIFDVSNNCNENDFFDVYTPNDTHTYNLRDIITNDGNPSGVVLPDGAYGVITILKLIDNEEFEFDLIGNLRVIDENGYEYRTNLTGAIDEGGARSELDFTTFNFNTESGVTLSDIIMIPFDVEFGQPTEVFIDQVLFMWRTVDVDIYDLNENPFSCRNVTFACVNQDHPLLEELLEESETSVASFEYGINNAIPHSKGGELLCPGNNISEGFVRMKQIGIGSGNLSPDLVMIGFVGLNNGNGRGTLDTFFIQNCSVDGSCNIRGPFG